MGGRIGGEGNEFAHLNSDGNSERSKKGTSKGGRKGGTNTSEMKGRGGETIPEIASPRHRGVEKKKGKCHVEKALIGKSACLSPGGRKHDG